MKKLLVIGASGLLGSKLFSQAAGRYEVRGTCNPRCDGKESFRLDPLDIGEKGEVEGIFERIEPDVVILAAAMTDVDKCEREPLLANRVNAAGPELVARSCRKSGARLVHVSTDYVFDGTKSRKYTEDDVPRPISVYGSSKLAGERAVLSTLPNAVVARPAVLYGWNPMEKDNFVLWVLKKLRTGQRATLFRDQRISPTFADDLARNLLDLADLDVSGIWHVTGPDCLSRPECGKLIAKVWELGEDLIISVDSSTVSLPAKRPKYSCLDVSKVQKLLNRNMVSFEEGLGMMRDQEGAV